MNFKYPALLIVFLLPILISTASAAIYVENAIVFNLNLNTTPVELKNSIDSVRPRIFTEHVDSLLGRNLNAPSADLSGSLNSVRPRMFVENLDTISKLLTTNSAALNATITGTVTNATSTAPIAGATAGSIAATTDAGGNYTINIAPGAYSVTASAAGYTANSTSIALAFGATVVQNFTLQPRVSGLSPEVAQFDTSGDGMIQRGEAVNCVVQFFTGIPVTIPRQTAVAVVVAFFSPV